MDRNGVPPEQPQDAAAERRDEPAETAPGSYGPLAVERKRKDDGRVLILYRRRETE